MAIRGDTVSGGGGTKNGTPLDLIAEELEALSPGLADAVKEAAARPPAVRHTAYSPEFDKFILLAWSHLCKREITAIANERFPRLDGKKHAESGVRSRQRRLMDQAAASEGA